ncbi:exodeoxyribonuclease V subunit alpha [Alcaligenaceae bacterium CGII-47]|nr:exodeoxyribonuclease V subunit alpha [Alcaligenaceae bacterium CGII-47]
MNRASLRMRFGQWVEAGLLRELDAAFACFLMDQTPEASPLAVVLAALCSGQSGHGHVCLTLPELAADPVVTLALGSAELRNVDIRALVESLAGQDVASFYRALDQADFVSDGGTSGPLVRQGPRLYLYRYWQAERRVRAAIFQRLGLDVGCDYAPERARAWLDALFPSQHAIGLDWQKLACANALDHAFCVIAGGPGTGKTTTVVKLLALLQGMALARAGSSASGLRIRLAAPTGKAAARLSTSISAALHPLQQRSEAFMQAALTMVPVAVVTVHRLLGSRPGTRRLRYHAGNRLPIDVLVIDEASMLDIEMLDAVLVALPDQARLILLGDKDQLASVEAGAVLGELCRRAAAGHYTPQRCARLEALSAQRIDSRWQDVAGTPLDQAVIMLRHSYRFDAHSGIGQLAQAVNQGDLNALHAVRDAVHTDLGFLALSGVADQHFDDLLIAGRFPMGSAVSQGLGYQDYLRIMHDSRPEGEHEQGALDAWAQAVLLAHGRFQVLCALREGPWGASGLNQRIEHHLQVAGLIQARLPWYPGRPVIVVRNHYDLGLSNGDIGVALEVPDPRAPARALIRVAFPKVDGSKGVRWVLPSRLPEVETVYALTVHKSQGSEFERVVLVLPEHNSPILTRELLYTGMTRARASLIVVTAGMRSVFDEAVRAQVRRASGLLAG